MTPEQIDAAIRFVFVAGIVIAGLALMADTLARMVRQ